jgi:hypothetical protein
MKCHPLQSTPFEWPWEVYDVITWRDARKVAWWSEAGSDNSGYEDIISLRGTAVNLTVKSAVCALVDDDDSAAKGSGGHTCELWPLLLNLFIYELFLLLPQ